MRETIVRPWLGIGDRDFCNNGNNYDFTIHIWRDDMPHYNCNFVDSVDIDKVDKVRAGDFFLNYKDGEHIDLEILNLLATEISATYGSGKKILIHCTMSQTRSPMIAMFALSVIEKKHPLSFLNDIYYSLYCQNKVIGNICLSPLQDLVEWYEKFNQ